MQSTRSRIEMLERGRSQVNLDAMSDAELCAYANSVQFGSKECYAVVLTEVLRQPTTIRVVRDDPGI